MKTPVVNAVNCSLVVIMCLLVWWLHPNTGGESWTYRTLWEDMRELAFPSLTTASNCFTELSPAAKAFVLDRWRKWKGLP